MGVIWLLTGSLSAQSVNDVFPSQEIVLADWGMSDVSEVGYLHFGVLHRRQGDALAVYDVRHGTPVAQWPSEPLRSTPPLDGDVFLLGHFDRGNTNRLGGYFNGFARAPSMSAVSIARAPDDGPALAYSVRQCGGELCRVLDPPLRLQATSHGARILSTPVRSPTSRSQFAASRVGRIWRCTSPIAHGSGEKDRF